MMPPANVLTVWSSLVLRSFADAGVRDVVISPGSRSTPLVVAAVREPRLRLHSIVDERAAAFFALGQARLSRRPSLLLCTSGSAAAHYLPAIIEARATRTPLLVLTADRPTELQDCTAAQTIDQVKIFGEFVNAYHDLGTAEPSEAVFLAVRRLAAQARFGTLAPTPGAVHLNARIRKPLEPVLASTPEEHDLALLAERIATSPIAQVFPGTTAPTQEGVAHVAALCRDAVRGLIACGPAEVAQIDARASIFALAQATGFPLLADATSQLRYTTMPAEVVVADGLEELTASGWRMGGPPPDLVLQIGAPLVSSAWERVLSSAGQRVVIAEHGWNDPQSRAVAFLHASVGATASALAAAVSSHGEVADARLAKTEWQQRVRTANAKAWSAIEAALEDTSELTEAHVARAVSATIPAASTWMLGNSLAVRVVSQVCAAGSCEVTMVSQRGAAGIDGLIAGAAGTATQTDRPVTLLVGDISFLHDLTSLAWARRAAVPLVIVLVNNGGGRIFEQLPLASVRDLEPEVLAQTVTPQDFALAHAGPLFGVRWQSVDADAPLRAALRVAYATPGCTVIEARVADHGNTRLTQQIRSGIGAALASGSDSEDVSASRRGRS